MPRITLTPCRHAIAFVTLIMIAAISSFSHAATCVANSTDHRVAMLELYTSEGCNSCPPADRWLNALQDRGFNSGQVVPLAFHVDYWDYIGWTDRYAQPAFSQRQRSAANRNKASFVYTPQFLLDGRDIRRPWLPGELSKRLQSINAQTSRLKIGMLQNTQAGKIHISLSVTNDAAHAARVYVVVFENGLHSEIKAGENAGKKLYHEFVVRELSRPVTVEPGEPVTREISFDLSPYAEASRLGIAAFAESVTSGETMQAMAAPLCDS